MTNKVDIKRLDSITKNDTTATEQINDNFKALQEAIENTLSRDGTGPNFMDADLDMNSYRIINSAYPAEDNDIVNLKYVEERIGGAVEASKTAVSAATQAANSAQSALVSSTEAINTLRNTEEQLNNVIQYVDEAKQSIDQTIDEAIADVKQQALDAAQESIDTAAMQATEIVIDYANNELKPMLNEIAANAEADAGNAAESAEIASNESDEAKHWAEDSRIWATGEDAEVEEIAPGEEEHSSRGYADLAMAIANTPEDVPVDTSKLLALQIIKGPKGDSSIGSFTGDNTIEGTLNVKDDSNHPLKITGLAGTSASGFQVVDSNGAGDSDFEHAATGDRYITRITNHNNTSNTSVSVDLYQSNAGRSVLDTTDVETVLVPTPAADDASQKAVNSEWVKPKLDDKLDVDVDNLTPTGKSNILALLKPSSNITELTPASNGTKYTAPANGWAKAWGYRNTAQDMYIQLFSGAVGQSVYAPKGWGCGEVSLFVTKGATFSVSGYNDISEAHLRFIYAEGESNNG